MNEDRDSLAEQAAAWVPPWARTRPDTPPEPAADADADADAVGPGSDDADVEADADAVGPGPDDADAVASDEADVVGPESEAVVPASGGMSPKTPESEMSPAARDDDLDAAGEYDIAGSVYLDEHLATDDEPTAGDDAEEPTTDEPSEADPSPATALGSGDMSPTLSESEMSPTALGELSAAGPAENHVAAAPPQPAPLALIDDDEMRGALEAILLVVDEPVQEIMLAQVMEQPTDRVAEALQALARGYEENGHGFELRRVGGGWRLYTRPRYAAYVERFVLDGQSVRLTQAALETLAVVAYKQPVTRSRISAIRGVNCDGVIRTLTSRGLVEECGTEPESGAFLYRTTTLFLEKLGLDRVDQLPPLAPFLPDDIDEVADAGR